MSMVRRVLVPFLIMALPVAAMMAYILYAGKAKINESKSAADTVQTVSFGMANWTIFRGDQQLTGQAEGELPDTLSLKSQFTTDGEVKATPVVADGIVYVGSADKQVYALDLQTEKRLWQTELDGEIEASCLILDNCIYVGTMKGTLFALNHKDGKILWSFKSRDKVAGSVNCAEANEQAIILLASYDGTMYALDIEGTLLWKYETDSYINGTPAVFNSTAAVGGCDAFLHLVPLTDPNNVRKVDTESYIPSSPAVLDGMAYVGNFEGSILAIDTHKAKIVWTYKNKDASFFAACAAADDIIVAGSREGNLYILDRATGKEKHVFKAGNSIESSPVICGNKVVFGCNDGRLYIVNTVDGKEIWSYNLGRPIISSPAVANNLVLVGCDDGNVYVFGESD